MELAHFHRWWSDKPTSIDTPARGVLLVTSIDDYVLTFRDDANELRLTKLQLLRDPDGGD